MPAKSLFYQNFDNILYYFHEKSLKSHITVLAILKIKNFLWKKKKIILNYCVYLLWNNFPSQFYCIISLMSEFNLIIFAIIFFEILLSFPLKLAEKIDSDFMNIIIITWNNFFTLFFFFCPESRVSLKFIFFPLLKLWVKIELKPIKLVENNRVYTEVNDIHRGHCPLVAYLLAYKND